MSILAPSTDTRGITLEESPKTAVVKLSAHLHVLPMLFKHSTQVTNLVSTVKLNEAYISSTYNSWLSNTSDYLVEIIEDIESSIEIIRNHRHGTDDKDVDEFGNFILNVLNDIKENSKGILVVEGYDEIFKVVSMLKEKIEFFIDLYPEEYFM